jgi:hypothetical protein
MFHGFDTLGSPLEGRSVVEEWFLVGVLGHRLLPPLQLLLTTAFIVILLPSSLLRWWRAPRRHLLLLSVTEDL